MTQPALADIDAFVTVARARGFRGAARRRGVSASVLSDSVRRLEAALGLRLLNRTTRSVAPTEAGQRLLDELAPVFGQIQAGLDVLNDFRGQPRGTLRLNVPEIVARLILPPIIARFIAAHPGITVDVTASNSFDDMLAEGFDAGIRYEERLERDMIAVPIGPRQQRYVMAAAPAYLALRGTPGAPEDLLGHACLRHHFVGRAPQDWELERDGETVQIGVGGPVLSTSSEVLVAAAEAGLGIAYLFEEFLRPALVAGRLVPVLEDWTIRFSGPFLYYPSRNHMPAPLRAFVDFVKAERADVTASSVP